MNPGVLVGTKVTITFDDGGTAVIVVGEPRPALVARLNTLLADEDTVFLTFDAVDTEVTAWYRRYSIEGIVAEPVILADVGLLTTPGKVPQDDLT